MRRAETWREKCAAGERRGMRWAKKYRFTRLGARGFCLEANERVNRYARILSFYNVDFLTGLGYYIREQMLARSGEDKKTIRPEAVRIADVG